MHQLLALLIWSNCLLGLAADNNHQSASSSTSQRKLLLFGTQNGFDVGGTSDLCYVTQLSQDSLNTGGTINERTFQSLETINQKLIERALDGADDSDSDSGLYTPQLLESCGEFLDSFIEPNEELPEDRLVFSGTPIRFHIGGQADFSGLSSTFADIAKSMNLTLLTPGDEGFVPFLPEEDQARSWTQLLFCNARFVGECNPFAFLRDTVADQKRDQPIILNQYDEFVKQVNSTEWDDRYIATSYMETMPEFDGMKAAVDGYVDIVLPSDAVGVYFLVGKKKDRTTKAFYPDYIRLAQDDDSKKSPFFFPFIL
jgi:hypothetical protein